MTRLEIDKNQCKNGKMSEKMSEKKYYRNLDIKTSYLDQNVHGQLEFSLSFQSAHSILSFFHE